MTEKQIPRRDFLGASAMVGGAMIAGRVPLAMAVDIDMSQLPTDFGSCPRKLEDLLKYIVQRRAAEELNQLQRALIDPRIQKPGQNYKATPEDAYVTWTAASAYRYKWSRFYRDKMLRNRAFQAIDNIARTRADGNWDDGGLNSFMGLHAFAFTVLSWQETGDVDPARLQVWKEVLVKTADSAMVGMLYGPYRISAETGQYANPEFYYLSGLAAVWKLTGQDRYRDEAGNALKRYDDWLFKGGGVAYFFQSSPVHNYQQLLAQSVALYWDLTRDSYAFEFMKRMAPYFPDVQHRSGIVTDAEHPQIKHSFGYVIMPAIPAVLASAIGDGENRYAADVAVKRYAESVDDPKAFHDKTIYFKNTELATYAAAALRLMEHNPLPPPVAPTSRRIFMDDSFRGVRSHWDDFTAATTTRQMSDSLAGAYLADEHEPITRLNAAVDGIFFEVIQGKQVRSEPDSPPGITEYCCTEWSPAVTYATGEGLATSSCVSWVCARYWGDMPYLASENPRGSEVSDWISIQHWAVWQDYLVGLGALRSNGSGGDSGTGDTVRVRWRLSPADRNLKMIEQSDKALRFQYGRLRTDLACLDQQGGFSFKPENITEAPRAPWTPLLVRSAPWLSGDFINVSTIIRPESATGSVQTKALKNGAAALFLESDGHKAHVWVVNLTRHTGNYLLDIPPGASVRTYKRNVIMPPVPAGQPGHAGLVGGEAEIWVLDSNRPINPTSLLAGLREGRNGR